MQLSVQFPLTLTPKGEGIRHARLRAFTERWTFAGAANLAPSPWGEGWGEGEWFDDLRPCNPVSRAF
jgi:hypothetical protein